MKGFTKIFLLIELLSIIFLIEIVSNGIVVNSYDLPPDGHTVCSQYSKTIVSRNNKIFKKRPCFIQYMFKGPNPGDNKLKFKCAYANITSSNKIPSYLNGFFGGNKASLDDLSSKGTSSITVYSTDSNINSCVPITDYYIYAEYGGGRCFTFNVKPASKPGTVKVDKTVISTMVKATENGYSLISCMLDFKNLTKCNVISAAFVCTFDPNASNATIEELRGSFFKFPLYNGPFLLKVDQTDDSCKGCRPNSPKS